MIDRLRRVCLAVALGAASFVAPASGVRATGILDLTGETLIASAAIPGAGQTVITWSCDEEGTSTFSFTATGIATGPYPGTFVATSSGTIGPQFYPPFQGVQVGPIDSFAADFTIDTAVGTITGTTSVSLGYLGGYCVEPVQPSPFSGVNLNLQAASYEASAGGDTDSGGSVLTSTYLCQSGCADVFQQTFLSDNPIGTVPGAPLHVTAAAGDGTIAVSWLPPASDGGRPIQQYLLTIGVGPDAQTFALGNADTSITFSGTDNDLTVTFTVAAQNTYGVGPDSDPSTPVTTRAGAPDPQISTDAIGTSGGTGTTDPGGAGPTPDNPVTTSVTVPPTAAGGALTIAQTSLDPAPAGFAFLGQQVVITSTAATDAANPLTVVFNVDPSLVPVTIFRNGVPIDASCDPAGTATPTPCIASGAGTATITILTAEASTWNVGIRAYEFNGFLSPVDNLPTANRAKAGSSIPVRFGLGGDQGLNLFAAGYPKSQRVTCDGGAPIDSIEETATASTVLLTYAAGTGVYQYIWKTDNSWAGSCRRFTLKLRDGQIHQAEFTFR